MQAAGTDPEAMEILSRTPQILVEGLLFPYTAGQAFVLPVQTSGGWKAVDALYDDMPRSTEQILHPDKYRAGEEPIAVAAARRRSPRTWARAGRSRSRTPSGSSRSASGCAQSGVRSGDASSAAAGWGGDRLAVLNGPGRCLGRGHALDLGYRRRRQAFQHAAGTAVTDGADPGTVIADGRDITIVVASADDILDRAVTAAGYSGQAAPAEAARAYIESGAEIPSNPSVRASVTCVARASASRAPDRAGSAGSTTRASR